VVMSMAAARMRWATQRGKLFEQKSPRDPQYLVPNQIFGAFFGQDLAELDQAGGIAGTVVVGVGLAANGTAARRLGSSA
jgi:hypothetical protein